MAQSSSNAAHAPSGLAPPKRLWRNYLLDPRFQLKYTGMICGVALLLMGGLGVVIFGTAESAATQASYAVSQSEIAFRESKTSAEILHTNALMNVADNPELLARINADLHLAEARLASSLAESRHQRAMIATTRSRTRWTLLGGGLLLVIALGLAGIVITHKLVGPVFKLKRLLREVGKGQLRVKERLRKGDELEDLFTTFINMADSLVTMQDREIADLDQVIAELAANGGPESSLIKLRALREVMQKSVG